jgi:hypothetical protein
MLSKHLGVNTYHNLLFVGYLGLAVGLPLSKVVLSISSMWILLILLLEGNFKMYFQNLRQNKAIVFLFALLLIQLISFLWSWDIKFALDDLNSKLPLYSIPVVFVAQPLKNEKHKNWLLGGFVLIMLITSFYNFGSYQHWWGNHVYDDIRGMSLLISHIRYALMITMATSICLVWIFYSKINFKWLAVLLFFWFGFYTYYAQILSGVMTFVGILIAVLIIEVVKRKNKVFTLITISLGSLITISFCVGLYLFFQPQKLKISLDKLPWVTEDGNRYFYHWDNLSLENGYPMYFFLCQEEMRENWNQRSNFPYDSLDRKGQQMEATIIRYLTSKGMYKDGAAIRKLTSEDIRNIENGIPTVLAINGGFMARLSGLKNELLYANDPNGQSISQRFIYWKTGWKIIQKNWLIGVGVGDIHLAFQMQYNHDKSPLTKENRNRTHNQYLSYMITFGVFGLFIFMGILYQFWKFAKTQKDVLALLFLTIACLSFLVEDTLETQMGVTFFAFFFGLFLSGSRQNEKLNGNDEK